MRAVRDLTEGNPFFAAEIANWVAHDQGVSNSHTPIIHIPDSVAASLPAPIVNVSPPEVHVSVPEQPPARITVNVPEQKAPEVTVNMPKATKADLPQRVQVVSMPQRVHTVVRNKQGQPEGSIEADA